MDIQAQTTSKAMAHFEAEVLRWQRELNMVSDIYRLLRRSSAPGLTSSRSSSIQMR